MQQEGVITFRLDFSPAPPLDAALVGEVNRWRDWLYSLGLIGQDPGRYAGFGFGNVSRRVGPYEAPPEARAFVISGTQTGHLARLGPAHYAVVRACYPRENRVVAEGPLPPSSESLTHGTLYGLDAALRWVMHVHAPLLWRRAPALGLPATAPGVRYGSPEMAEEVRRLYTGTDLPARRLFAMAGHEDGLVSFGRTAEEAAAALRTALTRASSLSDPAEG